MTDTWANDVQGAGPTLDDLFDLKGRAEIDAYECWCDFEGLDPWLPWSYRAWRADLPLSPTVVSPNQKDAP